MFISLFAVFQVQTSPNPISSRAETEAEESLEVKAPAHRRELMSTEEDGKIELSFLKQFLSIAMYQAYDSGTAFLVIKRLSIQTVFNYRIYSSISWIFGSRKLSEKWGSDLQARHSKIILHKRKVSDIFFETIKDKQIR